jgi:hypothetical protein
MVVRWKVSMQQLDFQIKHIPGKSNVVADPLSRLCRNYMKEAPEMFPAEVILAATFGEAGVGLILAPIVRAAISSEHRHWISKVHNSIAGHHGVDRTMTRLKQIYSVWEFQRHEVASQTDL